MRILIVTISLILICGLNIKSQPLSLHQLDQTKGLSNEFNFHITTDEKGFLWVSSRDGINQFSGERVKVYRPYSDEFNAIPNISSTIFKDLCNNYWFTTNNSINRIKANTDKVETFSISSIKDSYYYAFHLERDTFLWTIADSLYKINVYEPLEQLKALHEYSSFFNQVITNEKGDVKKIVKPLVEIRSGIEIVSYHENVITARDSFFVSEDNNGLPALFITFFEIENDTSIWIPTKEGLINFNPNKPKFYKTYIPTSLSGFPNFNNISNWNDNYLLVSSQQNGFYLFNKIKGKFDAHYKDFLIGNQWQDSINIYQLGIDKSNLLWFSVEDKGIFFSNLNNSKFRTASPRKDYRNKSNLNINSIIESNKAIYASSKEFGLVSIVEPRPYLKREIELIKELKDKKVNQISTFKNTGIWICNKDGISLMSDNENTQVSSEIAGYDVVQIADDRFITYDDQYIYEINTEKSEDSYHFTIDTLSKLALPAELLYDSSNNFVYLSQSDGLLRIFDVQNNFEELTALNTVGIMNSIYPSNVNKYTWIVSGTGLYRFYPDSLKTHKVTHPSKMLDRPFTAVVEDSLGNVWLSSYWGIYRYQPSLDSVQHFTQSDGLVSMQYVENSSLYASDGNIYFGGDRGVTVIDPRKVTLNENLPNIELIDCQINNKAVGRQSFWDTEDRAVLKHSDNTLSFEFAILEFSDPELNGFKYELKKNARIVDSGNSNPVIFNLLPSGYYDLNLYASNSDDVWTKEPKTIRFRIKPPIYLTKEAIALWIFLGLAIIYALYRNQMRHANAKRREAELKQAQAETETAVLRLQMNPHFVFNSMNSIISYILKKEIDTAYEYLQNFAELMRMILDSSEQQFTEIEEEKELLTLYLEAENMRLGQKLNYEFIIDPEIETEDTLIPTMILQPFIENAIWHGISPKQSNDGLIQIRISTHNDQLICEVEDNGVGRSYHKNRIKPNDSKALSITERRLALLSEEQATRSRYEIHDLYDEQQQACGTLIRLFLPLLD